MEGITLLHIPELADFRAALGRIGKVKLAHFDFSRVSSKYRDYVEGRNPNIFHPAFASRTLMDIGVYCVSPALYLLGKPKAVSASATFIDSGADASGASILEYDDLIAVLTYSKTTQGCDISEIQGDLGTILIKSIGTMSQVTLKLLDGTQEEIVSPREKSDQMRYIASDFHRFITQPDQSAGEYQELCTLSVDVCQALRTLRRAAGIKFPCDID